MLTNFAFFRSFFELLSEATEIKSDEALVFLALFRRKWAIRACPEREEEIRRRFSGEQVCLGKFILCGSEPRENWSLLVELFLKRLPHYPVYIKKEKKWVSAQKVIFEFPLGISLTVTFEPRSLVGALRLHHQELNQALWKGVGGRDVHIELARMLTGAWKSQVHRSRRKHGRKRFLLVDVDFSTVQKGVQANVEAGVEHLSGLGLDLRYACSTPCGGAHFVVGLNEVAERKIFRRRNKFSKEFLEVVGGDEIELKTGQCLTHVPGVNSAVVPASRFLPAGQDNQADKKKDFASGVLSKWDSLLV